MKLSVNTYPELNKPNSRTQNDLLISTASTNEPQLFPIYVFYNYLDYTLPLNCSSFKNAELLGCSIVPAQIIKNIIDTNPKIGICDIDKIMLPWHCLVCCKGIIKIKGKKESSLPYRAFNFLLCHFELQNISIDKDTEKFISGKLPNYVTKVMKGEELNENDWGILGVNGIMVINEPK